MKDSIILRSMIIAFLANYLFAYFFSIKDNKNIIKVPKVLSIILGAPKGIGLMPRYKYWYGMVNLTTFILGIITYIAINPYKGAIVYSLSWITLNIVILVMDLIFDAFIV